MPQQHMTPANLVVYAVVVALILYRASRPQRTSVTRMWIYASLLMLLGVFTIYEGEITFVPPDWEIAAAAVLGLVAGVPLGLLRGYHTKVSATDRHGVMQLGPSWATAGIYVGAFVVRAAVRVLVPVHSAIGTVVGDGLVIFAIGIIAATYYAIYRKYEALDHAGATRA